MNRSSHMGPAGWFGMILVLILAAALRGGYVWVTLQASAFDQPAEVEVPRAGWQVQGVDANVEQVVTQIRTTGLFAAQAPFSDHIERTAHISPGFPWLLVWLRATGVDLAVLVPCMNAALGSLTVLCLMLFVRRAFDSMPAALAAGVLAAIYPYWILNTAESADGVVTTFLVAFTLALGTRGAQVGGYATSIAFGLVLAALALVRAELLPFTLMALLWYVARCRLLLQGWLFAVLAILGFGNGVGPWTVRNYQVFGEIIPIADSAYVHLFLGNSDGANGGPLPLVDDSALRAQVEPIDKQAARYAEVGRITYRWIAEHPGQALAIRFRSAFKFLIGDDRWVTVQRAGASENLPILAKLGAWLEPACVGMFWLILVLTPIGWRLSHARAAEYRLATLAFILIPLPYVLTHAETLVGPRLPWDAVLICFSGYALSGWWRRA